MNCDERKVLLEGINDKLGPRSLSSFLLVALHALRESVPAHEVKLRKELLCVFLARIPQVGCAPLSASEAEFLNQWAEGAFDQDNVEDVLSSVLDERILAS